MRNPTALAALAFTVALAGAAQAADPAPKAATPAVAPATVEIKTFEVKSFEPKSLDASSLEIKTKDVGGSDLDRKLARKQAKAATSDASVMRAPSKPAIIEAAEAEAAAEAAPAATPATKDNAGSR